jgi:outer membrane putative beta-barrel porin/alpha-amylase
MSSESSRVLGKHGPGGSMTRSISACLFAIATPALATAEDSAAEIGKKLANPLGNVWALFTEIDYNWSEGDLSNGKWRTGQAIIVQPVMPFPLTENSTLITRPTLPLITSLDQPDGIKNPETGEASFSSKDGLGDMQLPMLYTKNPTPGDRWQFGYGPTFQFPTHSGDLGTDTWEAGPAGVVIYKTEAVTTGLLAQYWWSYAEDGNDVEDTSHGSLLYFGFWNLPNAWQVGFNPTITYNDKAASDNKWNVPVGLTVAKTVKFGNLPIKFQFGVQKSVVREEALGNDFQIKLNIIPVIPGLVNNPLF